MIACNLHSWSVLGKGFVDLCQSLVTDLGTGRGVGSRQAEIVLAVHLRGQPHLRDPTGEQQDIRLDFLVPRLGLRHQLLLGLAALELQSRAQSVLALVG